MKPSSINNNVVIMWKQKCFDMKIKIVSNSPKKIHIVFTIISLLIV